MNIFPFACSICPSKRKNGSKGCQFGATSDRLRPTQYTKQNRNYDRIEVQYFASSPKTWPLKQGNRSVWDEKCRTVAVLERCVLNTGSFACKIVRGEVQLAVERRGTLNTGGRNHKLDCICIYTPRDNEVIRGVYCFHVVRLSGSPSVHPSVRPQHFVSLIS